MNIILLLPAIFLLCLVFFIPLLRYFWLSLHAYSVSTGLELIPNGGVNWLRLLEDDRFWITTFQTVRFACVSVSVEVVLAIFIALLLDQKFKGIGIARALTLLPWALPTTIMALCWRWIFNTPNGPIERLISLVSNEPLNILSDPHLAWLATVLADIWKTTPFIALILLAGLQTISKDLYEAFRLEGGGKLQAFFTITLPLLRPYLLISLMFRLAQSFGVFDLIQILTGGGPAGSTESVATYAYINAMRFLDFGYSSTIILGGFIVLLLLSLFAMVFYVYSRKIFISKL